MVFLSTNFESFADNIVWKTLIQIFILAGAMLLGNTLRRKVGFIKRSLIPTSLLGGLFILILKFIPQFKELINADADIIAFDGTSRPRPNCTLKDIISEIKQAGKLSMADISTLEEGINCSLLGADIISTTLAGYTDETISNSDGPAFELLEQLVKTIDKPVILEGRIWSPEEVEKAFQLGAHSVVIGSAITRPQLITKRFCERK